ncbi:MAG: hypothetical protein WC783_04300 [Candidatus Paceibacterota bacterium]|jgi:hypothetical protein
MFGAIKNIFKNRWVGSKRFIDIHEYLTRRWDFYDGKVAYFFIHEDTINNNDNSFDIYLKERKRYASALGALKYSKSYKKFVKELPEDIKKEIEMRYENA